MSGFWRNWFVVWCFAIGMFGVVLAGGAFEATSGPVRLVLAMLRGPSEALFDAPLRFSLALLGAVSIGWAVTLYFVIGAAITMADRARPLWNAISAGVAIWFVIDSALSIATGFGLNAVSNLALATMYVVGLIGSGALKRPA